MDGTAVLVAALAATPPTLAIIAGNWRTGHKLNRTEEKVDAAASKMDDTNAKVDRIDHAVNNQPTNEPTLVENVKTIVKDLAMVKSDARVTLTRVEGIDTRLATVERKVG